MAHPFDSDDDPIDLFRSLHWVASSNEAVDGSIVASASSCVSHNESVSATLSLEQWVQIVQSDVDPTHQSIVKMKYWKHLAQTFGNIADLAAACEEMVPASSPITFMLQQSATECAFVLMRTVEQNSGGRFYVGTTTNPSRRWHGDSREDFDQWRAAHPAPKRMRPLAKGHCKKYTHMYLLALAERRTAALLEPYLIDVLKRRVGKSCGNKVSDARGMDAGMNYLYLVVGDKPLEKALGRSLFAHTPTSTSSLGEREDRIGFNVLALP
jgi:hypothetical protein